MAAILDFGGHFDFKKLPPRIFKNVLLSSTNMPSFMLLTECAQLFQQFLALYYFIVHTCTIKKREMT